MIETKPKIPATMLDAATAGIQKLRNGRGIGFSSSHDIAQAALEAAGVAAMLSELEKKMARIAGLEAASLAYLKAEEVYHAAHIKGEAGLGVCQKAAEAEESLSRVLGYKLKSAESAGGE